MLTGNVADAALGVELRGIAQRFIHASRHAGHPITADDYFNSYVNDLVRVLRSKSIELFNQNVDHYPTKQEGIDSLLVQLDYEKTKHGSKARTYEQLLHDLVLWYFVRDKRPAQVESPLDAGYWVVTVDYHFLGFDGSRRRGNTRQVPICVHPTALIHVHPTALIQMLQFWLPRTAQFEEAVLGSLRWPFLFQDFDPQAERVTIRILETLARFENVGDLSADVVASVLMDDALRTKLSFEHDLEKRVEIVKEALIRQTEKVQTQLAGENAQIREKLSSVEQERENLRGVTQKQADTISELQRKLQDQDTALDRTSGQLKRELDSRTRMEDRVSELEEQQTEATRKRLARRLLRRSVAILLFALLIR